MTTLLLDTHAPLWIRLEPEHIPDDTPAAVRATGQQEQQVAGRALDRGAPTESEVAVRRPQPQAGQPLPRPVVQIAERGRELVAIAREVEADVEAGWTAHLGEEATAALRAALVRLREVTDPYR